MSKSFSNKFELGDKVLVDGEKSKTLGFDSDEGGTVVKISKDKDGVYITAEFLIEENDFSVKKHTITMNEDFFLKKDDFVYDDGVWLKVEDLKIKTHVLFILDKSGSMTSIEKQARDSFNEQLETIIDKEKNARITFTSFNHHVDVEFVEKVTHLYRFKASIRACIKCARNERAVLRNSAS